MTEKNQAPSVPTAPLPIGYLRGFVPLLLLSTFLFLLSPSVKTLAADSQIQYTSYTVVSGDSLYLIAMEYRTTVDTLMGLNELTSTSIRAGQVLRVPLVTDPSAADCYHTVRSGDTLYLIAQRFGTSVNDLMTVNHLTSTTLLVNQALLLPENSLYIEHMVQTGDSLYLISTAFSTTVEKIKNLNQITSDTIYTGQTLLVPRKTTASISTTTSTSTNTSTTTPSTASWVVPDGTVLVHVASGQTPWYLAKKYQTSIDAIYETNHLHADFLLMNQPLFIPVNSTSAVNVDAPSATSKAGFGEWLDWDFCNWIFDTGNTATITDVETGRQFNVKRYGGSGHADCEPLTAADTQIMKEIYGGAWSWDRRAITVSVGGRCLAASMNGMPHGGQSITDNNFDGQFCVHFLNSLNHNTGQEDAQHQAMVQKAAGY